MTIPYFSKHIIAHTADYYYNLGIVTQRGTWKPWILYMLDAVEKTSSDHPIISNILNQMESTLKHARSRIKWYNKEVNELLFSQPYYIKPKLAGDALQISSRTALTKYFGELAGAGILTPMKDGREVFYINQDLVRILER